MKLVIRYCLPWGNFSNQVINIEQDQDIQTLQHQVEKKFGISPKKQILTFKRDGLTLKLLPGWPLTHYGLAEKAIVFLESFENKADDEEDLGIFQRDSVKKGGYFAKLGILNKIEEEEEDEDAWRRKEFKNSSPSFLTHDVLGADQEMANPGRGSLFRSVDPNSPVKEKDEVESLLRETKANNYESVKNILNKQLSGKSDALTPEGILRLKKEKIEQEGAQGWNALHWAVYLGHQNILNEFLGLKADLNIQTKDGWTPLQLAVYKNQIEIMKTLLKQRSLNVNEVTKKTTALHIAAKNGRVPLVLLLLEYGADPNVKAEDETADNVTTNEKIKQFIQDARNNQISVKETLVKPPIVKGYVYKKSEHLGKMNKRYLVMNPDEGTLIHYSKKEDYPDKPRQVLALKTVTQVKSKPMGIFNKNLYYFQLYLQKKAMFGCKSEDIANKWIEYLNQGISYTKAIEEQMQSELSNQTTEKPISLENYFVENTEEIELVDEDKFQDKKAEKAKQTQETKKTGDSVDSNNSNDKDDDVDEMEKPIIQTNPNKTVYFKSFEILKMLGSGAFGKVFMVREKETGETFALKALKKQQLIVKRQLKYAIGEANVLKKADNPFVLTLYYTFQTRTYMYFVLDLCPGGDLSLHLIDRGKFTEDEARFFIAELILAIEYLHSIDVIYRDLKPENILIGKDGHIKLADFGLSKEGVADKDIAKSFCGSPAYISPEMLKNKGVGKAADIYGIGTVLYEMVVGESPYYSDDIPELYERINKGKLEFPKGLSTEVKNLLTKLLHKDPNQRIGVKNRMELRKDPFFKSIDWDKLARKEIPPPKLNKLEEENEPRLEAKQIFNDEDYPENEVKANRIKNWTFVRAHH